MNAYVIIEQLASLTHFDPQTEHLISLLPADIHAASAINNSHLIRQLISGHKCFPDARTVVF